MVIKGNSRGNGKQLAQYLLAPNNNEHIRILDVDGQLHPDAQELQDALFDMAVTVELTKGRKGLYHAVINPDPKASRLMTDEDWMQAADILGRHLGLDQQRRVLVLHDKKGRIHAHTIWQRYDLEHKKLVSDSFSRLAQDRARQEMESVFNHAPTPHRNKHRPELKATLTELWQQTKEGPEFITAAKKQGYLIATGSGRQPFAVVDGNGRSFDLTRQLQGVRVKEVRQRLCNETLPGEKQAIEQARRNRTMKDFATAKEQIAATNPDTATSPMKSYSGQTLIRQSFRSNMHTLTTHGNAIPNAIDLPFHATRFYQAMTIP